MGLELHFNINIKTLDLLCQAVGIVIALYLNRKKFFRRSLRTGRQTGVAIQFFYLDRRVKFLAMT